MKLKWLGHACFLITSDSGLRIITDPYEPGFLGIISYAPVTERADIVTISHNHGDHNHIATLKGEPQIIQGPGRHIVKGIEITGIACYHDKVQGRERGGNTIFCLSIDGLRLCHCGDLGHPLDDAMIQSLGHVDVLFLPTGGPVANLELDEAIVLSKQIQPSIIIPMHFRNDKCNFPKYGLDDLLKLRPTAKRLGRDEITLTAGGLPKYEILILDHAL